MSELKWTTPAQVPIGTRILSTSGSPGKVADRQDVPGDPGKVRLVVDWFDGDGPCPTPPLDRDGDLRVA